MRTIYVLPGGTGGKMATISWLSNFEVRYPPVLVKTAMTTCMPEPLTKADADDLLDAIEKLLEQGCTLSRPA